MHFNQWKNVCVCSFFFWLLIENKYRGILANKMVFLWIECTFYISNWVVLQMIKFLLFVWCWVIFFFFLVFTLGNFCGTTGVGGDNGCFCSLFILLLLNNTELIVVGFVEVVTVVTDVVIFVVIFVRVFGCSLGLFIGSVWFKFNYNKHAH